jgi:hypothetical protein
VSAGVVVSPGGVSVEPGSVVAVGSPLPVSVGAVTVPEWSVSPSEEPAGVEVSVGLESVGVAAGGVDDESSLAGGVGSEAGVCGSVEVVELGAGSPAGAAASVGAASVGEVTVSAVPVSVPVESVGPLAVLVEEVSVSAAGGGASGGAFSVAGAGSVAVAGEEVVSLGAAGASAAGAAVGVVSAAAGAGSETSAIGRVEMATAPGAAAAKTPPAARAAPPTMQRRQRARVDGTTPFRTAFDERLPPTDRRSLLLIRSSFLSCIESRLRQVLAGQMVLTSCVPVLRKDRRRTGGPRSAFPASLMSLARRAARERTHSSHSTR